MAIVPITRDSHGKTRIRPVSSFAFAAKMTTIPIYGSEIMQMCHEVPVIFIRAGGGFALNALVGVRAGQNLMLDANGRWIGAHVPAIWRRGPFRLGKMEGQAESLVLCLDDGSAQVNETEGLALFDESGSPAPAIREVTTLLAQLERDVQSTRIICDLLDQQGLIAPWPLDIAQPDGGTRRVSDLFQVDEAKIAALSGEDLARLRDVGALGILYAHLLSLSRIAILGRLAKIADERERQQAMLHKGQVNLDHAFGIVEDDPFLF